MKSQRRHELQQNVLDSELGKSLAFFKRHGTKIAWGVLGAAVVVLAIVFFVSRHRQAVEEVQAEYSRLTLRPSQELTEEDRLQRLETLTRQDDSPRIAAMACVDLGDTYAYRALAAQAPDERAIFLEDAESFYTRVVEEFADQDIAVARARIGLGTVAATRGDFAAAREQYQTVLNTSGLAGQPAMLIAKQRLENLPTLSEPVVLAEGPPPAPAPSPMPETPTTQPAEFRLPFGDDADTGDEPTETDASESPAPPTTQPQGAGE